MSHAKDCQDIDRMLEEASSLVETGDYRRARSLLYGIEPMAPSAEQSRDMSRWLLATGIDPMAYAVGGTVGATLLLVMFLIF